MRTVVAPLAPEIEQDLGRLDDQLRRVAEGCIRRLKLEPDLGRLVPRGLLSTYDARAVLFDRDSRPEGLLGEHRGQLRVAGEEPSKGPRYPKGPRYRVVYRSADAPSAGVRVVMVLGVGLGHEDCGAEDIYRVATRRLRGQIAQQERRKR